MKARSAQYLCNNRNLSPWALFPALVVHQVTMEKSGDLCPSLLVNEEYFVLSDYTVPPAHTSTSVPCF